ncbi:MAG TPA: hypothetical protein VG963_23665, partial [Polyangiaceae bacterium]|nr:hypothetical protein [Polyangiaceae bacterium]
MLATALGSAFEMWHLVRRHELAGLLGLASALFAVASAARAQAPAEPDPQRAVPEMAGEPAPPAGARRALDESPLDDERARAHFVAGESYFAAQRWDDAAHEFASAYEFSRRPEMLINLSLA